MNRTKKSLRKLLAALLAVSTAGIAPSALAKAAYADEQGMIERAGVIAIVNVARVENAKTKGEYWTYSEMAHVTVQETLKGEIPQTAKLSGGEDFICAQVHFTQGRYLVFLCRDGELLVGCNWHLSVRPN